MTRNIKRVVYIVDILNIETIIKIRNTNSEMIQVYQSLKGKNSDK